jgi:membrane protein YdbS with pleckstrin-like domain
MSLFPEFENSQVELERLPQLQEVNLKPLQRNYLKAQMLFSLIWILILLVIICIIFIALPEWSQKKILLLIATPVFVIIGILPLIITYFGYFRKGYAIRQRDILYKTGLFWRKTVVLPFIRIQHSEVTHGPIDRMYGLASLKLFTAGGSTSDLSVPGLLDAEAHRLKDFIAQKTGLDEEE